MNIHSYGRAIRRSWWIVIAVTVLFVGCGAALTQRLRPESQSTVTFFVRTPAEQVSSANAGDQFSQRRIKSYLQLIESRRLSELVVADTQLPVTVDDVMGNVTAQSDPDTVLLTATVTDPSAERSLIIAESVARQFVSMVSELETPSGTTVPMATLLVTSAASTTPNPLAPRLYVNLGVALFAGLLVGICLALLREAFDRTVRDRSALEELTGSRVLGLVPFESDAKRRPLAIRHGSQSIRAEPYRYLRTNLGSIGAGAGPQVILVSSSIAGEGTSTTCANLAAATVEAGRTVLIVDGNLRRPRLDEYLHVDGEIGLSSILTGDSDLDAVLQSSDPVPGLAVLASGEIPVNPSALLEQHPLNEIMQRATSRFDVIIVDSPPLLSVSDAALWAGKADGVLLVVRYGAVSCGQVSNAVDALRVAKAPLLGVVMNMVPGKGARGDRNDRLVDYPSSPPRSRHEHIPVGLRR